jgi:hypothetical protein
MLAPLLALWLQQCPPPSASLTINPGVGAVDLNGNALPQVSWAVTCPPRGASCPNEPSVNLSELRTEFAAMPSERLGSGTGFAGASGTGPLPGLSAVVVGANVQFSALVECNNPGSFARVVSAPVVFAPVLATLAPLATTRDAADQITGFVQPDSIPVGFRVALDAPFSVELATDEPALVRVQGAGVDWSKTYRFPERRSADAVMQAVKADAEARFVFTQPGAVAMTVELAGVRSKAATFAVVAGSSTGGGGGGAGMTGGGGGADTSPQLGCTTAHGGLLLGALALVGRRRRSARS